MPTDVQRRAAEVGNQKTKEEVDTKCNKIRLLICDVIRIDRLYRDIVPAFASRFSSCICLVTRMQKPCHRMFLTRHFNTSLLLASQLVSRIPSQACGSSEVVKKWRRRQRDEDNATLRIDRLYRDILPAFALVLIIRMQKPCHRMFLTGNFNTSLLLTTTLASQLESRIPNTIPILWVGGREELLGEGVEEKS